MTGPRFRLPLSAHHARYCPGARREQSAATGRWPRGRRAPLPHAGNGPRVRTGAAGRERRGAAVTPPTPGTWWPLSSAPLADIAGPDYERVLDRLDAEHDNVRGGASVGGSRPARPIWPCAWRRTSPFWAIRGHYAEGRGWLDRVLAASEHTPTPARVSALRAAGGSLASRTIPRGRSRTSRKPLTTAQDHRRRVERGRGVAGNGSWWRCIGASTTDALPQWKRHWPCFRRRQRPFPRVRTSSVSLTPTWARLPLPPGDAGRAKTHAEEAVRRQRNSGFIWALGDTLRILGDVAREQGEPGHALAAYRESVDLTHDYGDRRFLANAVAGIAAVAAAMGRLEHAARLYSAITALRGQMGAGVEAWQRSRHEQLVARVQTGLPAEVFAEAWEPAKTSPWRRSSPRRW